MLRPWPNPRGHSPTKGSGGRREKRHAGDGIYLLARFAKPPEHTSGPLGLGSNQDLLGSDRKLNLFSRTARRLAVTDAISGNPGTCGR
jgi:hypothetical protein